MPSNTRTKPGFKFLWSHQGRLHRELVKCANALLKRVPFETKYNVASIYKKRSAPYSLVRGCNVVQIGAPFDTLEAGRSRGMYFSKLVGKAGKVLIIEPLPKSVEAFRSRANELGLDNVIVHEGGVWSEVGESHINVDFEHPATNYTGNTVDYSAEREQQFQRVQIKLDTVDNIIEKYSLSDVQLVSITTNWAEEEILQGMEKTIANGVEYICLAYGIDGADYSKHMEQLGYYALSHDDRGVTYHKESKSGIA